jgi:hypothetical protein
VSLSGRTGSHSDEQRFNLCLERFVGERTAVVRLRILQTNKMPYWRDWTSQTMPKPPSPILF